MEPDPIRGALDVAAGAVHDAMVDPRASYSVIAAAAVAAFNRRIAEHFRERGRINDLATAIELEDIAAAVERAAKEGA